MSMNDIFFCEMVCTVLAYKTQYTACFFFFLGYML